MPCACEYTCGRGNCVRSSSTCMRRFDSRRHAALPSVQRGPHGAHAPSLARLQQQQPRRQQQQLQRHLIPNTPLSWRGQVSLHSAHLRSGFCCR